MITKAAPVFGFTKARLQIRRDADTEGRGVSVGEKIGNVSGGRLSPPWPCGGISLKGRRNRHALSFMETAFGGCVDTGCVPTGFLMDRAAKKRINPLYLLRNGGEGGIRTHVPYL